MYMYIIYIYIGGIYTLVVQWTKGMGWREGARFLSRRPFTTAHFLVIRCGQSLMIASMSS